MTGDTQHAAVVESLKATASELQARAHEDMNDDWADRMAEALAAADLLAAPTQPAAVPQAVLAGHTGKRVPTSAGTQATVKRDNGEDWVVMARNYTPIASPAAPRSHRARHDVYVRLSDEDVAKTRGPWDGVNVDLDKDDQVVGVEVLAAVEITIDGHPVAATPPPELPGPERDLLYEEAKKLGLGEAYLERRGEKTWIRAARVVRAVHNHLPGRAPIGLREAKVLGEAIAVAFEDHAAARPAVDREALLDVLATADEDWRNQTEETDKPYLEHLADRLIAADAITGTP